MTVNRRLKASTLSVGSSKTSNTHQGTEDRSFSKQALEKCLNERRETRVGGRLGAAQSSCRRIGRWSEKDESRTSDFKMGTSGVAMKRSKVELEELE